MAKDNDQDEQTEDKDETAVKRTIKEEDAEPEKKRPYESSRDPGEKVRVARMTEGMPGQESDSDDASSEKDEAEASTESPGRREVDMQKARQEEASEEEGSQQDSESDEAGEQPSDEQTADAPAPQQAEADGSEDAADEPQQVLDEQPEAPQVDPDELEKQLGAGGEDATTEEFAAMFEGSDSSQPERRAYSTGDRVEGTVLSVGAQNIFIQLDPQTEGIAKRREFEDGEGNLEIEEGEERGFYITEVVGDEIHLGDQLAGSDGSIEALREAQKGGVPVEGKVTGTNKGGFEVEVHGVDAFCPISGIELGYTEEKDAHVGATYRFLVKEVRDGGRSVVVNRADLLREERKQAAEETLEKLEEGEVVKGVVTRTTDFGAFVDIGGVEGLVHVTELSHRYVDQPSDIVDQGEEIEVEVLEIKQRQGEDTPKIALSRKATIQDPWEKVNEEFAIGQTVEGTVTRTTNFGAFVEILENVEGLVHVSEMSRTEYVRDGGDVVDPGDKVEVEIQDIDLTEKRISLSMKAIQDDPWDSVKDDYPEGTQVQGTVENIEDFGAFIRLPSGITALLPRSEMDLAGGETPHSTYERGETVSAKVIDIDEAEQKMALSVKGGGSEGDAGDGQDSQPAPTSHSDTGSDGGFGTLGDLIGDELDED
jgi:small subunit ribosomal protein S1